MGQILLTQISLSDFRVVQKKPAAEILAAGDLSRVKQRYVLAHPC